MLNIQNFAYVFLSFTWINVNIPSSEYFCTKFLKFDKLYIEGESIRTSIAAKLMFIFLYSTEFTVMAAPFAVCFLLMVDPCMPPFLLSFSPSCSAISWAPPGREIFVVLFEACRDCRAAQLFSVAGKVTFLEIMNLSLVLRTLGFTGNCNLLPFKIFI